jgi:hypothetical protein
VQKAVIIKDDLVRYLTMIKSLGLGAWLVCDTLGLAHSQKIITLQTPKEVSKRTLA